MNKLYTVESKLKPTLGGHQQFIIFFIYKKTNKNEKRKEKNRRLPRIQHDELSSLLNCSRTSTQIDNVLGISQPPFLFPILKIARGAIKMYAPISRWSLIVVYITNIRGSHAFNYSTIFTHQTFSTDSAKQGPTGKRIRIMYKSTSSLTLHNETGANSCTQQ